MSRPGAALHRVGRRLRWEGRALRRVVGNRAFQVAVAAGALTAGIAIGVGLPAPYWLERGWFAVVATLLALDAVKVRVGELNLPGLAWSVPLVGVIAAVSLSAADLAQWDLMWLSAWLAVVVGWVLARNLPPRLKRTVERLRDRKVLPAQPDLTDEAWRELDQTADRWARVGAVLVVAIFATTGPWIGPMRASDWSPRLAGMFAVYFIPAVLAAVVVGAWSGRMAAYGRLGSVLNRRGLALRMIPDHPDGAGGLRPVGVFYLYQSLVAAVPAVFLLAWMLLFAVVDNWTVQRYAIYAAQYWLLFVVAIVIQILAFLLPMQSVHKSMRQAKETALWQDSDRLSQRIEAIRHQLEQKVLDNSAALESQLAALVQRFRALETAPTWPIDASIRRRFTLRNIGLLLPLVGSILGNQTLWKQLSDVFTGLD